MAISAGPVFKFNPSISFHIKCKTVEEVDKLWEKMIKGSSTLMELGEYPFSKRYGWLKDKFGVSWQITPTAMDEMMAKGTPEQIDRVTQAFLPMKKFDIAKLKQAFVGK